MGFLDGEGEQRLSGAGDVGRKTCVGLDLELRVTAGCGALEDSVSLSPLLLEVDVLVEVEVSVVLSRAGEIGCSGGGVRTGAERKNLLVDNSAGLMPRISSCSDWTHGCELMRTCGMGKKKDLPMLR